MYGRDLRVSADIIPEVGGFLSGSRSILDMLSPVARNIHDERLLSFIFFSAGILMGS
jgi:hypothetical protein